MFPDYRANIHKMVKHNENTYVYSCIKKIGVEKPARKGFFELVHILRTPSIFSDNCAILYLLLVESIEIKK